MACQRSTWLTCVGCYEDFDSKGIDLPVCQPCLTKWEAESYAKMGKNKPRWVVIDGEDYDLANVRVSKN